MIRNIGREIGVEPPDKDHRSSRRHGRRNQCGDQWPRQQPVRKRTTNSAALGTMPRKAKQPKNDQIEECAATRFNPSASGQSWFRPPADFDGSIEKRQQAPTQTGQRPARPWCSPYRVPGAETMTADSASMTSGGTTSLTLIAAGPISAGRLLLARPIPSSASGTCPASWYYAP